MDLGVERLLHLLCAFRMGKLNNLKPVRSKQLIEPLDYRTLEDISCSYLCCSAMPLLGYCSNVLRHNTQYGRSTSLPLLAWNI